MNRLLAFMSLVAVAFTLQPSPAEAQWRCPPGYIRNRFGRCVPGGVVQPRGCPPGYVLNRFGQCAPAVVQPRGCPPGFVMNRFGQCAPAVVQPNPRMCPPGYFFFRGRCVHR